MDGNIYDTHAHYDDEAFEEDRKSLLESLPKHGIDRVVNVGASLESSERSLELATRYEFLYAAVGVHPSETVSLTDADIDRLREWSKHPKCVAIGEIGLDYYWPEPDEKVQKEWFRKQLELAREVQKPVIIHSRDACRDTLDIMKDANAGDIGGVIHCYSYSVETAKEYLNLGFFFGIGGVITFKNAKKLVETVEYLPMDRSVIETDSPYLAPVPNRGKRNNSINLSYVVREIARIKGISDEEVRSVTWNNACRLYRQDSMII